MDFYILYCDREPLKTMLKLHTYQFAYLFWKYFNVIIWFLNFYCAFINLFAYLISLFGSYARHRPYWWAESPFIVYRRRADLSHDVERYAIYFMIDW